MKKKDDLQLTGLYRNALLSKCRLLLKEEIYYYSGIRAKVQTLEKNIIGEILKHINVLRTCIFVMLI